MTMWRPRLAGRSGPKFRQIADAIADDVARGRLAAGSRLPPQRDLAQALGVSLNTVTRAYAEATGRGFVDGEVGRGTYVRHAGVPPAAETPADLVRAGAGVIDFSLNLPTPGQAAARLAETLRDLAAGQALRTFLDYQTAGDADRHAAAAADWLGRVGLAARGADIVLTTGAQHGILIALLAGARPGDVLLVEALTYAPLKAMAHHLGLKLYPVAGDAGGLSAAALDQACRRVAGRVLYCLPTLHTPTTVTWDAERRAAIAAVARKHDLTLIEDDVFGFLPPERPPPLAHFAPERTLYLTSVSKSLAPGLRVGYVLAPAVWARGLRAAVKLSSWMPPPLMAEIASRWIEDGTADRLNAAQRAAAADRQALARAVLPAAYLRADPHGFHVWLDLPAHWPADLFAREAESRGVKVLVGGTFAVDPADAPNAVRLSLTHESARTRVEQGLRVLAELLGETGSGGSMVI